MNKLKKIQDQKDYWKDLAKYYLEKWNNEITFMGDDIERRRSLGMALYQERDLRNEPHQEEIFDAGIRCAPLIFPAQDVYYAWASQSYDKFRKDLTETLRRRPWRTYFVLPSVYYDQMREELETNNWTVTPIRISKDAKRTHILVKGV